MAISILDITNKVLRRLRETEVASVADTTYARLIADFVCHAHQEVMDAYDWTSLRHVVEADVAASQSTYLLGTTVTDGGDVYDADRVTNYGSILLYDTCDEPQAWIFDGPSATQGQRLIEVAGEDLEALINQDTSQSAETPSHFALHQTEDEEGFTLTLWPKPSATRFVKLRFWTPEPFIDIAANGTGEDTLINIPWRPVFFRAYALALNERGEELGEPGNVADNMAERSLARAIEVEMGRRSRNDELDLQAV